MFCAPCTALVQHEGWMQLALERTSLPAAGQRRLRPGGKPGCSRRGPDRWACGIRSPSSGTVSLCRWTFGSKPDWGSVSCGNTWSNGAETGGRKVKYLAFLKSFLSHYNKETESPVFTLRSADVQQFNNFCLSSCSDRQDNAWLHFKGKERVSGEGFTKLDGIKDFSWLEGRRSLACILFESLLLKPKLKFTL